MKKMILAIALAVPTYADPDADALTRAGLATDVVRATTAAPDVAARQLDRLPDGTLAWAAGGRLDREALDILASAGVSTGAPISTVTRPSAVRLGAITPFMVLTRMRSLVVKPWSRTKRAKQREPFPHCSTSLPSALWITYSKSMPSPGEGRTVKIWSAPTPKWRSPR